MREVEVCIFRYDPEVNKKAYLETYSLMVNGSETVLDLLHQVKWDHDGSLTFRRACGHGICGSDAMRINGLNRLACRTLVADLGEKVMVEPLLGLAVIKDFVVDLEPFWEHYRSVMPYQINSEDPPAQERIQSPAERVRYDDTTKCILCAACTTSCPSFWSNKRYLGPAAIVQAHRFIFDNRDQGAQQRLEILNDQFGVWRCRTVFNCTMACPRDIQITMAIGQLKRMIAGGRA